LENRVLLAFVLSLLVFFGWGYFLSVVNPPSEKPAQVAKNKINDSPTGSTASGVDEGTPSLSEKEAAPAVPAQPEFEGAEQAVTVINNGVTYQFSTQGATLREALFLDYKNDQGEIVDLVQHEAGAMWPLSIEASDDEITRILQNAYYETSTTYLELSESSPTGTVVMRLNHPSGLQVEREYVFQHGQPLIGIQTQITVSPDQSTKNLQYEDLWGPGMGGKVSSQTDLIAFSGPTTFVNNERVETDTDDFTDKIILKGDLKWTGFQNKYFGVALVPESGSKNAIVKRVDDRIYVGLVLESVQSNASSSHLLYAGTKQLQLLENSGHKLVRLIDYGWLGNKFAFLVKPLLKALQYFYGVTKNYGWSIILITIIIKVLFSPLTHKSFKSMKGMQKIQPYVKVIQERNKDDRTKMNEELLELYKKHKVNPLGGCLPMLLQIPVFIALYHALFFSIELRGAPFIGWIQDLSVSDPYYVTPILMGATMFLQQKMTPSVGDPVQQKIMMFLPIIFTFLFISFPAGLVLYWTVNNLLTISQQFYIYRVAKD